MSVHPSVHLSFPYDYLYKHQWSFTLHGMFIQSIDFVVSVLGLLMGKFRQFLTELSVCHMSIFLFPDDNLSKCQWIFSKLGVYIDIVKIWFGIANGQISSIV